MTGPVQDHDEADGLDPLEQLTHPDAEPTDEDPTPDEVQPGDDDYVAPAEGVTPARGVIL